METRIGLTIRRLHLVVVVAACSHCIGGLAFLDGRKVESIIAGARGDRLFT